MCDRLLSGQARVHSHSLYCAPVALNSPAQYSRLDSDWLSMFVSFISWKNDSNDIASLCFYRYSCGVDYSIILRMIFRTISL